MIKPAKSKWPLIQFIIHCRTCDKRIKMTIHYGQSNIWGSQIGEKLSEWASHDGHDLEVQHEFYDGYEMSAIGS